MVLEVCILALDQSGSNLALNLLHQGTQTQVSLEVQVLGYMVKFQSVHHDYLLVIVHRFDTVND